MQNFEFIDRNTVIAVDGNSLMHRAFYALPDMRAGDGTPTGALHGFFGMILPIAANNPGFFVVAFDKHGPTFRHEKYTEYKAGRRETPDDLRKQFPVVKDILRDMGIAVCEVDRFEADDIIGTFSRKAMDRGSKTLIVTGDRDSFQLINDKVHVLFTKKGITEAEEYTPETLMERYHLIPERMKDLKALMGDSSDHIPGVPGVGEKTALQLLETYGSLEQVYEHAAEIKGKLGEKIRDNAELAELSFWLGTVVTDAPVGLSVEDCAFEAGNLSGGREALLRLGLRSIASRIPDDGSAPNTPDTADVAEVECRDITGITELEEAAAAAEAKKSMALDLNGPVTFSFEDGPSYTVRSGDTLFDEPITPSDFLQCFAPFFKDPGKELIVYDLKALLHAADSAGIPVNNRVFDTMLADYLLNSIKPAGSYRAVVSRYTGKESDAAGYLFHVRRFQQEQMEKQGLEALYRDIEFPLVHVLYDMEQAGFMVDDKVLRELDVTFSERLKSLETEIYGQAGEQFNILSPKQLGPILFEKLGLPYSKKTKTGYSTDADALEKIKDLNPIVRNILEFRNLSKLKSTYIDGLLQVRNREDFRVRSRFNQCLTATGRISSSEPNLQNIPVRTEIGREIRKAFVAPEGFVLIDADYSQIELRILAHMSGDEGMIDAFNDGDDIHRRTASEVFQCPMPDVTDEMRRAAKAVNFGIVYGISDFGLSENLGIPVRQAREYIRMYLEKYPGVDNFMKKCIRDGKEKGFAETMFHRRRYLPELSSQNYNMRSFGERVAMNMPVQGTAADIIKIAMIRVSDALKEKKLRSRLVLQVHDELILETPEDEKETVSGMVRDVMEHVCDLSVPLTVDLNSGRCWYDTK